MKNKTLVKIILGISLAIAPISCRGLFNREIVFDVPKLEANTKEELLKEVAGKIEYKYDYDKEFYGVEDYWASPEETWNNKAGDCEDTSILDLYLLKRDFGIEGYLINGGMYGIGFYHYWIEVDGKEYESKTGEEQNFDIMTMRRKFDYNQVMEMFDEK